MTREQAIQKLTKTRELSTDLLQPLGISFESFLQFAQLPSKTCDKLVEKLINKLENSNAQ